MMVWEIEKRPTYGLCYELEAAGRLWRLYRPTGRAGRRGKVWVATCHYLGQDLVMHPPRELLTVGSRPRVQWWTNLERAQASVEGRAAAAAVVLFLRRSAWNATGGAATSPALTLAEGAAADPNGIGMRCGACPMRLRTDCPHYQAKGWYASAGRRACGAGVRIVDLEAQLEGARRLVSRAIRR